MCKIAMLIFQMSEDMIDKFTTPRDLAEPIFELLTSDTGINVGDVYDMAVKTQKASRPLSLSLYFGSY